MALIDTIPLFVQLSVAGDATKTWSAVLPSGVWRCASATFDPSSAGAVTANDSNYAALTVKKGSTTVASVNTTVATGASWVAGTPAALTVSGTGTDAEFTGGTDDVVIEADGTAGTGQPIDGILLVVFQKIRT